MRIVLLACLVLVAALPCGAAEDLLKDLRAEVAAVTASASLKSGTGSWTGNGAPYAMDNLRLVTDDCTYELAYKSFLPPNEARNQPELNDWSGGMGMIQPSDKGWYTNGFLMIALSDGKTSASTADHCAQARIAQGGGKAVAGDFTWQLPTGQVTDRFFVLASRPELFLAVTAKSPSPQAVLSVTFQCYPGGFNSPFDRWVHTALRAVQAANKGITEVKLDPTRERWAVLADHYAGVTPRPMGPCSVAVAPEGLAAEKVVVSDNYSVRPGFDFAPGQTTGLFAIREFAPSAWQAACADVSASTDEALAAARAALATLPK